MLYSIPALQQGDGGGAVGTIIYLIVVAILIASLWVIFTKAGEPGWASIIPIYNTLVLLKIAGKPGWWLLLFLIPLVNIVIGFMTIDAIAKAFGKGTGFALGLIFLAPIFYPMLAFGDAQYQGAPM